MTSIAQAAAKNRGNYPNTPEQDARVITLVSINARNSADRDLILTTLGIIEAPVDLGARVTNVTSCTDPRAGTYAGARVHLRRHERMCDACATAHRIYKRRHASGQRTK